MQRKGAEGGSIVQEENRNLLPVLRFEPLAMSKIQLVRLLPTPLFCVVFLEFLVFHYRSLSPVLPLLGKCLGQRMKHRWKTWTVDERAENNASNSMSAKKPD